MPQACLRIVVVWFALLPALVRADDKLSTSDAEFFEAKVRPLLIAKCQECHAAEKPKNNLRLDSREALLTGGDSGPAAVVEKPTESLLLDVISYRGSIQMPPKAKLPEADIATLTEWVRRGLPWTNSKPVSASPHSTKPDGPLFTDEQKAFWAFQPVKRVEPPAVKGLAWVRSPLDRFILTKLEAMSLSPAREADRRTLIRRITFDLIGLPPTSEEVAEFLTDPAPDALDRVVDRLLASPRYGERWARHWLDVARYADSNGLDENLAYASAFRYRDYVVKAFREDKPYDEFLVEQIAGDLLESRVESGESRAGAEPRRTPSSSLALDSRLSALDSFDALTATGFLSLGAKMLAEDDPVKMQMDIIDEQVDTVARAVMGLTLGCARCHDHKFDPLPTEDYYSLAGIFKSTKTMDNFSVVARWQERPLATPEQLRQRDSLQTRATEQKQLADKLKADAAQVVLDQARTHVGMYLLAATRDQQLAALLKSAKPRGDDPEVKSLPGVILIEAEDYARGNVLKDRDAYGKGIGVLVNKGETPNFTEYDIDLERAATYQFELRYAAAGSRPVKVFANGQLLKTDAAAKVTGSWTPESQTWFVEAFVTLKTGHNTIRLEQPTFFPHIDKLLLTTVESSLLPSPPSTGERPSEGADRGNGLDGKTKAPLTLTLSPADGGEGTKPQQTKTAPHSESAGYALLPSLVTQWSKALDKAKDDPKSTLIAWHQFAAAQQLKPDEAMPENGVKRLLGETPPASLNELAARYQALFDESRAAWVTLKATPEGKDTPKLADPVAEAARMLLIDPQGPFAIPADVEQSFTAETQRALAETREEMKQREQAVPKFPETMAVSDATPENLKIHLRGSHLTLGKEVPRRFLRVIAGEQQTPLTNGSGRLDLAKWLTNPQHPLTARVMANRVWQWHFGQALVRSPDNFGRLGERPTHPALLDWLAGEFAGNAWSIKQLHRQLVTSAAYRMSTTHDANAALVDPENRLLWRFNRQRLEVEQLRDALLAVSGSLDEATGGTLLPTANRAYVTSTANVNPAIYNSRRRSIYLPVVRSALFEVFTAFDFADPSTLNGQRDQTTVAPQALFMMNSEFVLSQSRSLAEGLLARSNIARRMDAPSVRDPVVTDGRGVHPTGVSATATEANRICELYELAYSRQPSEAEVTRATTYLDRLRSVMTQSGVATIDIEPRVWTSLCRAVLAANEFVYVE